MTRDISIIEQKPYEVLFNEMADIETGIISEIEQLGDQINQKQVLLRCIRDQKLHYLEMMQNG